MNSILQFLAGNAWLLIPIFIGVFNVMVRAKQKAAEQKARRDAQAEMARRKAEALRTGRSFDEPVIVYDQPSEPQADDRKARIEALRQQRMEQLRAIREKRASVAAPKAPQRSPNPRQSPRQRPPVIPGSARNQGGNQPTRTASKTQSKLLSKRQSQNPIQASAPKPAQPTRPPASALDLPKRLQTLTPQLDSPLREASGSNQSRNDAAPTISSRPRRAPANAQNVSTRALLHNRQLTRQAIVVRELLDAPVALRNPDIGPGSMSISG
jgi:hypothetical protein